LKTLASRFSREDLLRAFDLLTRAEADIRGAAQPRYHLEMALLRWIHLRKLVPIEDLLTGAGTPPPSGSARTLPPPAAPPARTAAPVSAARATSQAPAAPAMKPAPPPANPTTTARSTPPAAAAPSAPAAAASSANIKDAFLAEIRKSKVVFYNTVVAQAQKIECAGDRITFTFSANHRTLKDMFDQNRTLLESLAQQVGGHRVIVTAVQAEAGAAPAVDAEAANAAAKKTELRAQALADAGVQAMLEVFPAEIRDVEEM
jgi:DNA polymerase-3 subunit gamma/tau